MNYEQLLTAADQEGLLVKEQPLTGHDGLIRGSRIAIRKDIETQAEKSCVLAEEIGHYRTSSGNILDQNKVESRKQEYRARLYGYNLKIGLAGLISAYEAGCRNLQLDDCTWGAIVGDAAKQRYKLLGTDIEDVKKELLEVNNLALEGKPEDMVITSHICRGNYHSTFFTSGPYDSVADYVFAKENVDALFLEYDDARSGGFAPLAKVSPDKKVVLGLITTKTPELEDKEVVIKRIHEAAKYIPLDRLYLSPQCGFASCEIGNKLTEEEQWAKLKLVKEIAEEVWGE